ncbi:TolC family protein [Gluconacetobacter sp. 1b LMG 1731]|uniref:TolC family protein n=1 Tax=Gluconacetobacter dulcium TaxID=2729096 RepID=A0A7W4NTX0_9PROT|nr:TolC family protein [Gluconacetobacter dulcium]MBB2166151.1 TolC family protein [Gluconacetobacter dulcium]MBB2195286.1 TolC family protein [Gluconacetobacter dulcium]
MTLIKRRVIGSFIFVCAAIAVNMSHGRAESLHDAIIAARSRDPETHSADIDHQTSQKTARALDAWFPSGPVLSGQYLDDHFIGSKVGYTTYQGGISVPLWLPGQGKASVRNAEAGTAVADARIKVQRLLVSVRVLDLTSLATSLSLEIANLDEMVSLLDQTLTTSRRAVRAGEVSPADEEAVEAEKEDFEAQVAERRQSLDVARAELETATGSDEIPDLLSIDGRMLSVRKFRLDPDNDPRIALANSLTHEAQTAFDLTRHSYMPNPQIGIQVSRQEQYDSPWDTQVGVQFQVPLPSAARNTPKLMKDVSAIGAARRDAELARRKVAVEYRRIRAQMASAIVVTKHARASHDALRKRAVQLDAAWRAGETPIIEYIRARRGELEASQRLAQADVIWRASLVRILLMSGQTP